MSFSEPYFDKNVVPMVDRSSCFWISLEEVTLSEFLPSSDSTMDVMPETKMFMIPYLCWLAILHTGSESAKNCRSLTDYCRLFSNVGFAGVWVSLKTIFLFESLYTGCEMPS